QAATDLWHGDIREARLPVGDTDLAHIDVAPAIHGEAMGREKLAHLESWPLFPAEPCDAVALGVDDRQPWAEVRYLEVDRHAGPKLADQEGGMLAAAAKKRAGAV